jgi:hypothetical protein
MARPLRIAYPGVWHHVNTRGNEQKDVFNSRKNSEKSLDYPALATSGWIIQHFTSQGFEVE